MSLRVREKQENWWGVHASKIIDHEGVTMYSGSQWAVVAGYAGSLCWNAIAFFLGVSGLKFAPDSS
jgi:hypothetical protein